MRKEDKNYELFTRHDRVYENASRWYFKVRQGAEFGPYETKQSAQKNLTSFVSILESL